MSILVAKDLAQSFGQFDIFSGIAAKIDDDQRIGLLGPNGVGKTSLLNILAKVERPVEGRISLAPDATIGYLHQEAVQTFANKDHTIQEEMLSAFDHLQTMETRLRSLEGQMAEGDPSETLFEEYNDLLVTYEEEGLTHLSGGQKTRALMARLLLEEPSLLILDEPTNHLDADALEWLEETLKKWESAMLIVSHDRYFLNEVVNVVWEMSATEIETYRGNYDAYTVGTTPERVQRRPKTAYQRDGIYPQTYWLGARQESGLWEAASHQPRVGYRRSRDQSLTSKREAQREARSQW